GQNVENLSRLFALHRVCGEVADVPYRVDRLVEIGRQLATVDDRLDLVGQVPRSYPRDLAKKILQASSAKGGSGLGAVRKHETAFNIVVGELLRDFHRDRRTIAPFGPYQSVTARRVESGK